MSTLFGLAFNARTYSRGASWEAGVATAVQAAASMADTSGLPQTVFRDADSGGWWHTNAWASRLERAEMAVTVMPARYWR